MGKLRTRTDQPRGSEATRREEPADRRMFQQKHRDADPALDHARLRMEAQRRREKGDRNRQQDLFFFNDTATTEIYTLSLHDALPISDKTLLEVCVNHTSSLRRRGAGV